MRNIRVRSIEYLCLGRLGRRSPSWGERSEPVMNLWGQQGDAALVNGSAKGYANETS